MEVEGDRNIWGPQAPHKHQPPVMLTWVCGCSSLYPVAQEQPRARGKGLGSIVTSSVIFRSSLNWHKTNHAYLRRERHTWDKALLPGACFLLWFCSPTSCKTLPFHGGIVAWALLLTPGSQQHEDRRSPQLKGWCGP